MDLKTLLKWKSAWKSTISKNHTTSISIEFKYQKSFKITRTIYSNYFGNVFISVSSSLALVFQIQFISYIILKISN